MLCVTVVFVVHVSCNFFAGCFLGKHGCVKGVSVSDVRVVGGTGHVVLFIGLCRKQVMLCRETEVVRRLAVREGGFLQQLVVLF